MKRFNWIILLALLVIGLALGPMAQYADYHDFSDQHLWLGSANGKDVWSNTGFVMVGLWGMLGLVRQKCRLKVAWLSMLAMVLTGAGSAFYHLTPNDATLLWDRLPISLTCAGLMACSWAYVQKHTGRWCYILAASVAIIGVVVWHVTGDLRWYLGLQIATIVLVPLWLKLGKAPTAVQAAMVCAVAAYVLAKVAEVLDHHIWVWSQHAISGHTLKHLLATLAMVAMVKAIVGMVSVMHTNASVDRFANRKFGWPVCPDQSDPR